MVSCFAIQHEEPEGLYSIRDALETSGIEVEVCRVFAGDSPPATLLGHDGLVVMGGPMSATSDESFPSRAEELALVHDAVEREMPTLGVCLGAQLLALAAGGEVYEGHGPEIGWGTVELSDHASDDPLLTGLPDELDVLHWHGDTFRLPEGAVHLASSRSYENQAFRIGRRAWGFQFHVEVDAHAVEQFVSAFGDEARTAGTTPEAIRSESVRALARLGPNRELIVDRFAVLVGAGSD